MWNYIVIKIKYWYNRVINMSRPKSVKYGSGEVLLKNLTEEEKIAVEKLLAGPPTEVVETEDGFELQELPQEEPPTPLVPMPYSAIGMVKIGTFWSLVKIPFNADTKAVGELEITVLHSNRNVAAARFAQEQMKAFGKQF